MITVTTVIYQGDALTDTFSVLQKRLKQIEIVLGIEATLGLFYTLRRDRIGPVGK